MAKPIGILGGTFDPVHYGHLRLALEVYQSLDMAEVRLIPVHTPTHRQQPVASGKQRLTMLQIAIKGVAGLVVDDREITRGDTSYTIDTLKSLRKEKVGTPLCLIMGMDAFQLLNTWHEWTSIPDYAHIVLADRDDNGENFEHGEIEDFYSHRISKDESVLQKAAGKILKINLPVLEISASRIRALFSQNKDPRFLLPDSVIEYIKQESLYS
jgi:nicotinate-nucleotide adenylyltransferase